MYGKVLTNSDNILKIQLQLSQIAPSGLPADSILWIYSFVSPNLIMNLLFQINPVWRCCLLCTTMYWDLLQIQILLLRLCFWVRHLEFLWSVQDLIIHNICQLIPILRCSYHIMVDTSPDMLLAEGFMGIRQPITSTIIFLTAPTKYTRTEIFDLTTTQL